MSANSLTPRILILIGTIVLFYALPFFTQDTGMAMSMLLGIMPLTVFVLAVVHGAYYKNSFFYVLAVGVLFLPTLWIYYNESAWVYIPGYMGIALLGWLMGKFFLAKR